MRNVLRRRYLVPFALLVGAGVAGMLAFAPSAAQASAPNGARASSGALVSQVSNTSQGIDKPGAPIISYKTLPKSYIAPGEALFAANCASCHGNDAAGTALGPNLLGLGSGTVDFWVSTGRMPLEDASAQATEKPPKFNRLQTLEIAAYVQSLAPGGVGIPTVNFAGASVSSGQVLFTLNCAACHTITGAGDELAFGAYAPSLHIATVQQIVEALRTGPGDMPHFGPGNITNAEARDIALYVHDYIQHPVNRGGFGLGGIGPVGEGFVALLLGVGTLMLVGYWIGDRA
ncbi:MAG: cytochrome bc1 complex diheme cytochrome c subunit [Acidimicrobiales bacterium]|jgi:ubiquinol-cytochrome c reductase cytochrome c subunit